MSISPRVIVRLKVQSMAGCYALELGKTVSGLCVYQSAESKSIKFTTNGNCRKISWKLPSCEKILKTINRWRSEIIFLNIGQGKNIRISNQAPSLTRTTTERRVLLTKIKAVNILVNARRFIVKAARMCCTLVQQLTSYRTRIPFCLLLTRLLYWCASLWGACHRLNYLKLGLA